jgi:hypothetical protein
MRVAGAPVPTASISPAPSLRGDHARVRHRRSEPALALLDIAAIDAGRADADANLAGAGLRVG